MVRSRVRDLTFKLDKNKERTAMSTSIEQAIELILSADKELINILGVTARTTIASSVIALLLGVPIGMLLGSSRFRGRGLLIVINRTLMGMPPVVCGLILYMLFSGVGPFRHLRILFTVKIMILAQVILITPLVIGTMETYVSGISGAVKETALGMGLGRVKIIFLMANECVYQIISTFLLGFSRAIAEVGAVSMVGGGIAWKTNMMTTAIMQYTNQGKFSLGIALGIILISLSFIVNAALTLLQRRVSA